MSDSQVVDVAVGVILRQLPSSNTSEVLIAKRADDAHQGGLWEFPGGKVEPNESAVNALIRELDEEVGIQIDAEHISPLITIQHHYPANPKKANSRPKTVRLLVFQVQGFHGEPMGAEGQPIKWAIETSLQYRDFPAANKPIIQALKLGPHQLITGKVENEHAFLSQVNEAVLSYKTKLIQFRAPELSKQAYLKRIPELKNLCQTQGVQLQLNAPLDWVSPYLDDSTGLHLNTRQQQDLLKHVQISDLEGVAKAQDALSLREWMPSSLSKSVLVSASCHDRMECQQALALGVDFINLSPVKQTKQYDEADVLGWTKFQELIEGLNVPVFALGGLLPSDLDTAKKYGAQGIAAIKGFGL